MVSPRKQCYSATSMDPQLSGAAWALQFDPNWRALLNFAAGVGRVIRQFGEEAESDDEVGAEDVAKGALKPHQQQRERYDAGSRISWHTRYFDTGWPICCGKEICWHQLLSSVTSLGHRINLQLNATSNLESTYPFPEADGPPCMHFVQSHNAPQRAVDLSSVCYRHNSHSEFK